MSRLILAIGVLGFGHFAAVTLIASFTQTLSRLPTP